MAGELVTIEANVRQGTGKGYCRKARRGGKVPANLLHAGKSTLLEIDPKFLSKAYKSEGRKFNMVLDGKTSTVTIKELQIDVIKRTPLHVDLMNVT